LHFFRSFGTALYLFCLYSFFSPLSYLRQIVNKNLHISFNALDFSSFFFFFFSVPQVLQFGAWQPALPLSFPLLFSISPVLSSLFSLVPRRLQQPSFSFYFDFIFILLLFFVVDGFLFFCFLFLFLFYLLK
jgi:hypothetical protein